MTLGGFAGRTVALDLDRLESGLLADLRQVCARLNAGVVEWRVGSGPLPACDALISALRFGERTLPAAVLAALEALPRRVPLLLLCAEQLVRPAVGLHQGLVTLIGHAPPPGCVYSELRIALARSGGATSPALLHELCGAFSWCAALSGSLVLPTPLLREDDLGVAALLPLDSNLPPHPDELPALAALLRDSPRLEEDLARRLGDRRGFVALRREPREWVLYWPASHAPLWFCSPSRLPRVVEQRTRSLGPLARILPATPGEAVLALPRAAPSGMPDPAHALGGAPEWLERSLPLVTGTAGAWSAFAIEARS